MYAKLVRVIDLSAINSADEAVSQVYGIGRRHTYKREVETHLGPKETR